MKRLYVSTKNETVRMFENDFLEFFSHVHPLTLYLPAVAYVFYLSFAQTKMSILAVGAFFALGILFWTLLEYVIHRWCFHYQPKTTWGRKLHFVVHHDYPNDDDTAGYGVSSPLWDYVFATTRKQENRGD